METQLIEKLEHSGEKKISLLKNFPAKYWLRAVMAGMYLTIVGFVYWSLLNNISDPATGKLLGSLFFGVGLTIIIFTNSELFTSNNMYLVVSSLKGKTRWQDTFHLWTACYLGNLLGSVIIALLLWGGDILKVLPADHILYDYALNKARQPGSVIFIKGIMANWIVCLAVFVAMGLKDEIAKMFSIILIVFIFLYLGFEHSIANMGTFSISLAGNGSLTLQDALYNLLFSTPGNIVGGGLFVGMVYVYLNEEMAVQKKTERLQEAGKDSRAKL